jgi:hypothetical protein
MREVGRGGSVRVRPTGDAARREAVVIRHAGLERGGVDLDGVIALGRRAGRAARNDARHARIARHHPFDGHRRIGRTRTHARPEDHPIAQRIAARHAVTEDRLAALLCKDPVRANERHRADRHRRGRHEIAARKTRHQFLL